MRSRALASPLRSAFSVALSTDGKVEAIGVSGDRLDRAVRKLRREIGVRQHPTTLTGYVSLHDVTHREFTRWVSDPRTRRATPRRAYRAWVRRADAHPARRHSSTARGARRAGAGRHGNGKDRRVRAAVAASRRTPSSYAR